MSVNGWDNDIRASTPKNIGQFWSVLEIFYSYSSNSEPLATIQLWFGVEDTLLYFRIYFKDNNAWSGFKQISCL